VSPSVDVVGVGYNHDVVVGAGQLVDDRADLLLHVVPEGGTPS
jgi:hypothetical protein